MNPQQQTFFDLANVCLALTGYPCDTNPWTKDTVPPPDVAIHELILDAGHKLSFSFPNDYRHFLVKCSRNLINTGFFVPWDSPRNIIDENKELELENDQIAFWHEEDGSLFCFSRSIDQPQISNELGAVVYPTFRHFLHQMLERRMTNALRHLDSKAQRLQQLADKLEPFSPRP